MFRAVELGCRLALTFTLPTCRRGFVVTILRADGKTYEQP
jgi:hypothetical protein